MKTMILAAAVCLLAACTAPNKGYVVSGYIEGAGNGKAVLATTLGRDAVSADTVEMKDGRFTFRGELPEAMNAAMTVIPDGGQPASFKFVLENSRITASGRWADVAEQFGSRQIAGIEVAGSRNEDFMKAIGGVFDEVKGRPEHREYNRMFEEMVALREKGDAAGANELHDRMEPLAERFQHDLMETQKAMILAADKDLPAAAFYLYFLSSWLTLEELEGAFDTFDEQVRQAAMTAEVREDIAARKRVLPGNEAPGFTLAQPDGTRLSLADFSGRVVVLDFWASWCQPCRKSFPAMKEFYGKYRDRGVEIVGISNDADPGAWKQALEEDGLPWPQAIDEYPGPNAQAKVAALYSVPYLPTLIVIDRAGRIAAHNIKKEELETCIDGLLEL